MPKDIKPISLNILAFSFNVDNGTLCFFSISLSKEEIVFSEFLETSSRIKSWFLLKALTKIRFKACFCSSDNHIGIHSALYYFK
jgi:hypothetical protein